MSVRHDGVRIRLEGACEVEDAEPLLALLQRYPGDAVDLAGCTRAHGAVVQLLLAFGPVLIPPAAPGPLADIILPALAQSEPQSSPIGVAINIL
jgi:hypothetical protein